MIYLLAFLCSGSVCLLSQIVFDNTKFTPGHITTFLVGIGAILSSLGLYEKIISICGGGATILITNFSYLLIKGMEEGMQKDGLLGIFTHSLTYTGGVLSFIIFISLIASLFCHSKH